MKTWIHQIQSAMRWQQNNYKLLHKEWQNTLDDSDEKNLKLMEYIESYGKYMHLKGRYEQWHIDAREVEGGTF